MRISERKQKLRERSGSGLLEPDGVPARAKRTAQPRAARTVASRGTGKSSARATTTTRRAGAKPRAQRGPRFFSIFGIVGIFFSVILIQSTVAKHNSDQSAYTTAVKHYPAAKAAYAAALSKYHQALAHHAHPTPVAPHVPAVPHAPSALNIASFSLPILYIALSLAYLFLAYRAARQKRLASST